MSGGRQLAGGCHAGGGGGGLGPTWRHLLGVRCLPLPVEGVCPVLAAGLALLQHQRPGGLVVRPLPRPRGLVHHDHHVRVRAAVGRGPALAVAGPRLGVYVHLEIKSAAGPLQPPPPGRPVHQPRVAGRGVRHGVAAAGGDGRRGGPGGGPRHVLQPDALARPRPGRPAGLGEVVRAEVLLVHLPRVEEAVQQPVDQLDGGEEHEDEHRVDQPHVPVKCGEVLTMEIVRIKLFNHYSKLTR